MCDVTDLIAFNGVLLILLCIYTQSSIENWLIYRLKSYFLYVRRSYYTQKRGKSQKQSDLCVRFPHTHKHTTKNCYLFYFYCACVSWKFIFSDEMENRRKAKNRVEYTLNV